MEEYIKNRKINFSYATLVIILFAAVCFLTDYIIIERNYSTKGNVVKDCVGSVSDVVYDYGSIAGLYSAQVSYDFVFYDGSTELETSIWNLYLYTDGTFYYRDSYHVDRGELGNFTIEGNYIILNRFFSHGSDISVGVDVGTKKIRIDSSLNLIDESPRISSLDSVTLVKSKSLTAADNENSIVKDRLENSYLYNDLSN